MVIGAGPTSAVRRPKLRSLLGQSAPATVEIVGAANLVSLGIFCVDLIDFHFSTLQVAFPNFFVH